MSTSDLINYYANLLILQYIGKPNAYAMIQALVTPVIMDQLPVSVMNAFNVVGSGVAEGVQLDVIGKYVGVSRVGHDLSGNPITLNDNDFLKLIQIAIISNNSGSSLAAIQSLFDIFFAGEVLIFDYQNMRMGYFISSTIGSPDLVQLLITEGLLPKPMGVQLATTIFAANITNFFGFRTYDLPPSNAKPFNTYDLYNTNWPWLTYSDGIGA